MPCLCRGNSKAAEVNQWGFIRNLVSLGRVTLECCHLIFLKHFTDCGGRLEFLFSFDFALALVKNTCSVRHVFDEYVHIWRLWPNQHMPPWPVSWNPKEAELCWAGAGMVYHSTGHLISDKEGHNGEKLQILLATLFYISRFPPLEFCKHNVPFKTKK